MLGSEKSDDGRQLLRRKGPENSWFLNRTSGGSSKEQRQVYQEAKEAGSSRPLPHLQDLSDGICWDLFQSLLQGDEKPGCNLKTFLVNGLKKRKKINECGNQARCIQKPEALF